MTKSSETIDLQPFCEQDQEVRYLSLTKPFIQGGKKYATDSRICVEVDAEGEPDTPRTGEKYTNPPNAKYIFDTQWKDGFAFSPWPDVNTIDGKIPCPECEDEDDECDECDGSGVVECDLGHDHDCDRCGGDGFLRNRKCGCKGTGYIVGPEFQRMGEAKIAIVYDQKIRNLPQPVEWAAIMNGDGVQFRFPGGRGIVMCVKHER